MLRLILLSVIIYAVASFIIRLSEDTRLSIPQIIRKYKYPVEEHWVKTEDDYILTIFRIPHGGNRNKNNVKKTPVLLVHGVVQSSSSWVLAGPKKALAYNLADNGYDVWLINCRGTTYSRNHTYLDANSNMGKFWDFSFYEMGVYDLPATIDYILEQTNQSKLFYTGVSQGATIFFILCSELPRYNDKIEAFVGLAPAVFLKDFSISLRDPILYVYSRFYNQLINLTINLELLITPAKQILMKLCEKATLLIDFCWTPVAMIAGFNPKEIDNSVLFIITGHSLSSFSSKQAMHFFQFAKFDYFGRFRYGEEINLRMYNSTTVPLFDLSKITVPIYIFYSEGDRLVEPRGVLRLAKQLRTVKQLNVMSDKKWSHLDFNYGKSARKVVNEPIIQIFNQYSEMQKSYP